MWAAQSSYRDRTPELFSIIERHQKSTSPAINGFDSLTGRAAAKGPRSAVSIQSEFTKRASKIGFGAHQASQKLAKLAKLAKRTSLYDDPTLEIQELTAVIKQGITALNAAVVDLQLVCNNQNESGNISSDTSSHSTTNLKVHENRRQLFSSTASKESTNPFVLQRPLAAKSSATSTPIPHPWANGATSSSSLFPRKSADGESQPLLQQEGQQLQQLVPLQDTYMQSRGLMRTLMKPFQMLKGRKTSWSGILTIYPQTDG